MSTAPSTVTPVRPVEDRHTPDGELGWRYETITRPNGTTEEVQVPLTIDEALHPEEGYIMPIRTYHDRVTDDLCDMLRAHFAEEAETVVYHDLIFVWDHPDVRNSAPDIAIVPNVRNVDADRGQFVVAEEGTRPRLVIEVVSPKTRTGDRVDKVRDYALAGVQEYIYIDHWNRKGQTVWEVAGYRLAGNHYLPMVPDEDGAFYLETINLRVGIDDGQVWLEDGNTGEDLLTNLEVRRALAAAEARTQAEAEARAEAEIRAQAESEARQAAEAHAAVLEAELEALRRQAGK